MDETSGTEAVHSSKKIQALFLLSFVALVISLSGCHTAFGIYHTVEKGENLYRIALAYGVSVEDIRDVNFLREGDPIYPGDQLYIPGASKEKKVALVQSQAAKKADRIASRSRTYANKPKRTASIGNAGMSEKGVSLIWPADGTITSKFGMRNGRMHNGIDIAGPIGTPIVAAAAGEVIYSNNKQRGYGNLIILQHANGYFTVYAHNHVNLVKEGERVKRGAVIAQIGNTGRTSGPHLHFEVRHHRELLDPMKVLP